MNILSYSYGKDSGACIHVCLDILKWPIDRIVTADVWATDTIPAVLPEMWEWQCKADEIIKSRYGITVEHVCARNKDGTKKTYENTFYKIVNSRKSSIRSKFVNVERERERETSTDSHQETGRGVNQNSRQPLWIIYGFPTQRGPWCTSKLKSDF